MSSNVVVIDSSLRRYVVKTTPQKPLGEVLNEACAKFGYNPDQYGLKYNDKSVDLSRTIRLSNFIPGARLTLVQASKSPTVVSVALQLPQTAGSSSTRLTGKFPSDTSLWQILRRFESGVAGGEATAGKNLNFTQRASIKMSNGVATDASRSATGSESGAGRLFYEMPVFNVLGRQLDNFGDLQKTLAQLGIQGSAMLRLDFRGTQQPLEEAMANIQSYFQASEEASGAATAEVNAPGPSGVSNAAQAPEDNAQRATSTYSVGQEVGSGKLSSQTALDAGPALSEASGGTDVVMSDQPDESTSTPGNPQLARGVDPNTHQSSDPATLASQTQTQVQPQSQPSLSPASTLASNSAQTTTSTAPPTTTQPSTSPTHSPTNNLKQSTDTTTTPSLSTLTIYSPPPPTTSLSSPSSFNIPHNPSDYIPTTAHALSHQALLSRQGRNTRLASDAELASRTSDRAAALAAVSNVTVRLRFMDQSVVERVCGKGETVRGLWGTVGRVMDLGLGVGVDLDKGSNATKEADFEARTNKAAELVELRTYAAAASSNTPSQAQPQSQTQTRPQTPPSSQTRLDPTSNANLITDLGWTGRVLVTVVWRADLPVEQRRTPCLRAEFRERAVELKAPPEGISGGAGQDGGNEVEDTGGKGKGKGKKSSGMDGGEKEAKARRLLGKMIPGGSKK